MDLYRLSGTSPKDFDALALPHVFSQCISLIEWPSRLQAFPQIVPPKGNLLEIDIHIRPLLDERTMTLTTLEDSSWKDRLKFLVDEGMVDDLVIVSDENNENGERKT